MNLTLSRNLKALRSQNILASWGWAVYFFFFFFFCFYVHIKKDFDSFWELLSFWITFIPFFRSDIVRHNSIRREWLQGAVTITRKPFNIGRQTSCNSQGTSREEKYVLRNFFLHKTRFCLFFSFMFIYYYFVFFLYFLFWQIHHADGL